MKRSVRRTILPIAAADLGILVTEPSSHQTRPAQDDGRDLFPRDWPCEQWDAFQQRLLAVVYERSATLWPTLRAACSDLTGTIEHQVYEGQIDPSRAFIHALPAIPRWQEQLPTLRQASRLLGQAEWQRLFQPKDSE